MTPQPLMSPHPCTSIELAARGIKAERARHRARGIERTSIELAARGIKPKASSARHRADRGRGFERTAHRIASAVSGSRARGIEWTARCIERTAGVVTCGPRARGQRLRVGGARSERAASGSRKRGIKWAARGIGWTATASGARLHAARGPLVTAGSALDNARDPRDAALAAR